MKILSEKIFKRRITQRHKDHKEHKGEKEGGEGGKRETS
jgi:hypothetical protein